MVRQEIGQQRLLRKHSAEAKYIAEEKTPVGATTGVFVLVFITLSLRFFSSIISYDNPNCNMHIFRKKSKTNFRNTPPKQNT